MSQIPSDPSWLAPSDASPAAKPRTNTNPGNRDFAGLIEADAAVASSAAPSRTRQQSGARRSGTGVSHRSDAGVTRTDPPARSDTRTVGPARQTTANSDTSPKPTDRTADAASTDPSSAKHDESDRDTKSDAVKDKEEAGVPPVLAPTAPADPVATAAAAMQPAILPDPVPDEEDATQADATGMAVTMLTAATAEGVSGEPGGSGPVGAVDQGTKAVGLAAAFAKDAQLDAAEPGEADAPPDGGEPPPDGAAAGKPAVTGDDTAAIGVTKNTQDRGLAKLASPKDAPEKEDQPASVQGDPAAPAGPQSDPATGAPRKAGAAHVAGKAEVKDGDGIAAIDTRSDAPRPGTILAPAEPGATHAAAQVSDNAVVPAIGGAPSGPQSAASPMAVQARTDTVTPAVPVAMLGVEIAAHVQAGKRSFDIRLDPPELGRVHVRLDVDRDGKVTSRLVVDRAETLDLLRRDAPQLERALQDAGLKTDSQTMQFMLRDQQAGQQGGRDDAPASARQAEAVDAARADDAAVTYSRMITRLGGLDIRV